MFVKPGDEIVKTIMKEETLEESQNGSAVMNDQVILEEFMSTEISVPINAVFIPEESQSVLVTGNTLSEREVIIIEPESVMSDVNTIIKEEYIIEELQCADIGNEIHLVCLLYIITVGSRTGADDSEEGESDQNATVAPSYAMHRLIPSVPDDVYLANVTASNDSLRNTSLPKSVNDSRSINVNEDGFKPFRPSAFLGTSEPYYIQRRDITHKNRVQFSDKQDSAHSYQTESLYHQQFPFDYKQYLKAQANQDHPPAVVEPTPDGPEAFKEHNTGPYWPKAQFSSAGVLKNKKPVKFEHNFDGNEHFENSHLLEGNLPPSAAELLNNKKPLKFEDNFHVFNHFEISPLLQGKTPVGAAELFKNKKPIKFEENLNDYDQFENAHLLQHDEFKYPYFIPASIHPTTEATKHKPEVKVYEHKHAIKSLLQLAAALIPIGLFVAALQPTVIQVNSTQPKDKTPGRFRSLEPEEISLLNSLKEYGLGTSDDPECERKSFCQFIFSGSTAEPDTAQNALWQLVTRSPSEMRSPVYLSDVVDAVRSNQCDTFKCGRPPDSVTNSTSSTN